MRGALMWLSVMLAKLKFSTKHGPSLKYGM